MKKILLCAFVTASLLAAVPSGAVDLTVGATTWYSWWDMTKDGSTDEIDPAWLYGPALTIKLNDDFGINSVFLFGSFDAVTDDGMGSTITVTYKRYDSDTSLSCRISNYFKVFGGFKYMAYKSDSDIMGAEYKFSHEGIGPGAGISVVLPLVDNFFLLANISGMYIWGAESNTGVSDIDYNEYGYNTSASIAYYIPSASVTLSLGGRYQNFKTVYENSDENSDIDHKFYGYSASATYSFGIGD